jgi:IclR family mhp operon transcriptional activator
MSIHRAMIGNRRPLFRSALGKALLSAMPERELRELISIIKRVGGPDAKDATWHGSVKQFTSEVGDKGYASAVGTTEDAISAIAVPIRGSAGVVGAINIIFFRNALSPEEAAERYLAQLRICADNIEAELGV